MSWPAGGPRTWNAGETVTAQQMNEQVRDTLNVLKTYFDDDGKPTKAVKVVRQTSSVTKNGSAVYGDLTGLSFPIEAGETWIVVACLFASAASATPNMKFTFTGPASPTGVKFGVLGFATPITAGFVSAFGSDAIVTKGTIDEILTIGGIFRNGANAGTVQLQFAQNTSNGSNSVIGQESFLVAIQLL